VITKRTPAQREAYQKHLREQRDKVQSHADGDYACGNKRWVCACGACREFREQGFKPAQERKPLAMPF